MPMLHETNLQGKGWHLVDMEATAATRYGLARKDKMRIASGQAFDVRESLQGVNACSRRSFTQLNTLAAAK